MMARGPAILPPPGERRHGERRKKDGLGLLPPARTPDARLARDRLNKLIGFLLVVVGAVIVGGLIPAIQGGNGSFLFGMILALLVMGHGIGLIARRERRRGPDRRRIRSRKKA